MSVETAKSGRREDILAAAEALIRLTGSTDFSMRELAETAGISTYTTYNLIGSKSTVLYWLLNRSIDRIDLHRGQFQPGRDPVQHIFTAGKAVADVFGTDAVFYRPLMRHLLGVLEPVHRPAYMKRAFEYWLAAFTPMEKAGLLRPGTSAISLARNVQVYFTGAVDYWVHGEMSGDELHSQVQSGIALCLLSQNLSAWNKKLEKMVVDMEPIITDLALRTRAGIDQPAKPKSVAVRPRTVKPAARSRK
ncbi:MAG: TetR/AcrR family transcriptional regulator [Sphingobium sp.]